MTEKVIIICAIICIALTSCSADSGSSSSQAFTTTTPLTTTTASIAETTTIPTTSATTTTPLTTSAPQNLPEAGYAYADYNTLKTPAKENGRGEENVYIISEETEYDIFSDCPILNCKGNDGEWTVLMAWYSNTDTLGAIIEEASKEVRIYGTYLGFSEATKKPAILAERITIGDEVYNCFTYGDGLNLSVDLNVSFDFQDNYKLPEIVTSTTQINSPEQFNTDLEVPDPYIPPQTATEPPITEPPQYEE